MINLLFRLFITLKFDIVFRITPKLVYIYGPKIFVFYFFVAESGSDILLKLTLDIVKTDDCNRSYLNTVDGKLKLGILADSMICAGSYRDNEDTCAVCVLFRYHT